MVFSNWLRPFRTGIFVVLFCFLDLLFFLCRTKVIIAQFVFLVSNSDFCLCRILIRFLELYELFKMFFVKVISSICLFILLAKLLKMLAIVDFAQLFFVWPFWI